MTKIAPFPLPNQSIMVGNPLQVQWLILDPLANRLGAVVSNGGSMTIGKP